MSRYCQWCGENVESGAAHSCKQAFESSTLAKVLRNKQATCVCNDKNGCEVTKIDGVHASWCDERSALLAEIEELKRGRAAARGETQLRIHQLITCGVAASHSDASLSMRTPYVDKWNSQQAEEVRVLRTRAEAAEAREKDLAAELKKRCACEFEDGVIVTSCKYHTSSYSSPGSADRLREEVRRDVERIADIAGAPSLCNRCEQIWEIASKLARKGK